MSPLPATDWAPFVDWTEREWTSPEEARLCNFGAQPLGPLAERYRRHCRTMYRGLMQRAPGCCAPSMKITVPPAARFKPEEARLSLVHAPGCHERRRLDVSGGHRLEMQADRLLARQQHRDERINVMNSSISTFTDRPPKPWRAPEFESPLLINARDLRPLGEVRGYLWWTHPKHDGELVERPKRLTDRDVLPNRMLVQVDEKGERSYRIFDIHAPGTFAASADTFGAPPLPPLQFRSALPPLIASGPRPKLPNRLGGPLGDAMVDGRDRPPIVRAPKVRQFGPGAYLADWSKRGVVVSLATDREHEVVRERKDVLGHDPALLQAIRDALPLTLPYLRGDPAPTCVVGSHDKGEDTSAVDVGVLGAVSCLRHAQEKVD